MIMNKLCFYLWANYYTTSIKYRLLWTPIVCSKSPAHSISSYSTIYVRKHINNTKWPKVSALRWLVYVKYSAIRGDCLLVFLPPFFLYNLGPAVWGLLNHYVRSQLHEYWLPRCCLMDYSLENLKNQARSSMTQLSPTNQELVLR